eukprot:TRINITY_DN16966_c0_g1_i1.p1 TRINITY_DN16966_c0_g1~~TRINITY_DN16966_c0_g1_i1.p1  ORF type:complete len:302 (+),score=46.42 TRINITY_DN16966_c0_g1_i1:41-946(+)
MDALKHCLDEGGEAEEEAQSLTPSWGEPDGEAYSVVGELAASGDIGGIAPLRLPSTIYGAAISTLLLLPEDFSWLQCVLIAVPMWMGAILTMSIQVYICFHIVGLIDPDQVCHSEDADSILRIMGLLLFEALMLNCAKELLDIHRWLSRVPSAPRHRMMRMQRFKDIVHQEADRKFGTDTMVANKVVTGITPWERLFAYTLVISKLLVLGLLSHYGAGFVLKSLDNETIIMNSVALVFIIEVEEYIFTLVQNRTIAAYLDNMPEVGLCDREVSAIAFDDCWPLMSLPVLGIATSLAYKSWC